ncbi:MAG: hypothetical protein N3I35_09275 [Clostridia bacterium]|nr:hypothetical protein [Clostridia bacterium]
MFYHIRFQTGETLDIIKEMKKGNIPCMDVADSDELNWFISQLEKHGIYKVEGIPYDKNARDRINEPEFEFRIAFSDKPLTSENAAEEGLMYIDFYFEPFIEETYDPVGEM